jgi:mannose-1-phosphate guanylyltransferase
VSGADPGRPLLAYWLEALSRDARIDRVLINTHYLPEQVRAFVAASPWRAKVDLVHEPALLGTGGTILANRSYFGGEPLFVAHADNLTDADFGRLIDAYHTADRDILAAVLAFRTATPQTCGILELDSARHVVGFHEKVANPPGNLASGAVYVFSPAVVDRIAAFGRPVVDLSTEVIPDLLPRMVAMEHKGFFLDIGSPEALEQARISFAASARDLT